MGVPEMRDLWARLHDGAAAGTLDRDERALAKRFAKAVKHLTVNPFHPGLQSHEIDDLTKRYGQKVFESYLENNTPAAGRLFWVYGPERQQIKVIALEPHPEDAKNSAYRRVKLADLPKPAAEAAAETPAAATPGPPAEEIALTARRRRRLPPNPALAAHAGWSG